MRINSLQTKRGLTCSAMMHRKPKERSKSHLRGAPKFQSSRSEYDSIPLKRREGVKVMMAMTLMISILRRFSYTTGCIVIDPEFMSINRLLVASNTSCHTSSLEALYSDMIL